jgi:nitroreductase
MTNAVLEAIKNRRSVRNFNPEQIKKEEVEAIIEAGLFAPSAMNQQSWHFTVIQDKNMLAKINEVTKAAFLNSGDEYMMKMAGTNNFSPFYNAPTFIIVSGDEKAIAPHNDGSLAIGNMLLAAHSMDIGSCWIHAMNLLVKTEEGRILMNEAGIPEGYVPVGSVAVGYSASEKPAVKSRKTDCVNYI